MNDSSKPPGPRDLADLIRKLDAVMEEASRLRAEVTRQLTEQRQQERAVAPAARDARRRRGVSA